MQIKNEFVKMKLGNKEIIKKNMILDTYLKAVIDGNFGQGGYIRYICLKLINPYDVDYNSNIFITEYDLSFSDMPHTEVITSNNSITVNYTINTEQGISVLENFDFEGIEPGFKTLEELENLNGLDIVGIAFCDHYRTLAYLDTREYNLKFNNKEILQVSRKDILKTDGYVDGFDYPHYLAQRYPEFNINGKWMFSELYSVGFGSMKGKITEEYVIGRDIEIQKEDFEFSFELTKNNIGIDIYPNNNQYSIMFPTKSKTKYIIYKYRFYYTEDEGLTKTYIDKYYTLSVLCTKNGDLKFITKVERSQ